MFTPIRVSVLSVCLLACFSMAMFADQITLKNGDRLTGSIVRYDGKNVVIKSEFAGEVAIPWSAVTGLTSSAPLHVGLKAGELVVGTVQADESKITVQTKDAGAVSAARDTVVSIRSKDEQAAYDEQLDRYRNPRLTDLWAGFLDLGYAQSKGNANAQTFNLTANAARATNRDKVTAYFTSIFSKGTVQSSGASVTTANAKRGGVSYNLNVNRNWFGFGSVDLENDQFQSLDLRFVPAGGLGYHAITSEKTSLGSTSRRRLKPRILHHRLEPDTRRGTARRSAAAHVHKNGVVPGEILLLPGILRLHPTHELRHVLCDSDQEVVQLASDHQRPLLQRPGARP